MVFVKNCRVDRWLGSLSKVLPYKYSQALGEPLLMPAWLFYAVVVLYKPAIKSFNHWVPLALLLCCPVNLSVVVSVQTSSVGRLWVFFPLSKYPVGWDKDALGLWFQAGPFQQISWKSIFVVQLQAAHFAKEGLASFLGNKKYPILAVKTSL